MTDQQFLTQEEWLAMILEIGDQIINEVTYAGLVRNIPSTHQHHTEVIQEILQVLATSSYGSDNIVYDFQYIYTTHHTPEEIEDYFNSNTMTRAPYQIYGDRGGTINYGFRLTDMEPGAHDAIARQFARRVVERLGLENIALTRQFLNRVVGLPGDFSRSGYPPIQPRESPSQPLPPPPPPPPSTMRRRRLPPRVADQAPVASRTIEPGTGKVLNAFPKPKGQRHVAGPRRRLLCKETKTSGGRCTSLFQGYSDLMRHCRERHDLSPKGDYDVTGCGPFSHAKVQQKRPGHSFPPFGEEKEDEESGGEEDREEEEEE